MPLTDAQTVSDLGEEGLIALVTSYLPRPPSGQVWSGDDAAVIPAPGPGTLFTTDTLVEGQDFDRAYCDGFDLGWKAMAVNVSDIAAMGGRPTHAVATLALPPDTTVSFAGGIARGLAAAADRWDVAVVGGDVSAAPVVTFGVALLGTAGPGGAVRRNGARPGDAICLTGPVGGSWGGLELLSRGLGGHGPALVERHLRPGARVEEGRLLAEAGATAMIDVSDGLAVDLARLMRASGTGCTVDPAAVPVDVDLHVLTELGLVREEDVQRGAILGGEDFELLATVPPEDLAALPGTVIGEVTEETEMRFGHDDLEELGRQGWDHLRDR